jgi:transcriptional regulator with XRE-family HTH domain
MAQEKLARAATLDRTYVSMIERGVRSPTIRTVVRLAEVLDVRPSEIVQRMENLLPNRRRSAQADMRPPNPRM